MPRLLFFFIVLFLAGNSFSCKSKTHSSKSTEDIGTSYTIIYSAFAATKEVQEDFFREATERLGDVRYDKDASVNTEKLQLLLDNAKSASQTRIEALNYAQEVDEEIKYKEKALKYVRLLDTLYKNEFVQFIDILNSNAENRFEKCQAVLLQRMQEMKKEMDACHEAGDEIREKYNIQDIPTN